MKSSYRPVVGILILVCALAGCSSNNAPIPAGARILAIVDVAVGDRDNDVVLIWYDVLNSVSLGAADVVLDSAGSQIRKGSGLDIANNMLFVANQDNDSVTIYHNFLNLTDSQAPDVVLTNSIDRPRTLRVHNGDLYVPSRDNNTVTIFRNVTTLVTGDAPDAVLDSAGSMIDEPFDVFLAGDTLYVANEDNDTVTIYNNASTLTTGAAPDVVLDSAGSFMDEPKRVGVFDNVLYVSGDNDALLAFSPANALTNSQAPTIVLGGPSLLDEPHTPTLVGGRLWVPNRFDADIGPDDFGLFGFNNPAGLSSGAFPDVMFKTPIEEVHDVDSAGGALFGISRRFDFLFIFLNPATVRTDDPPELVFFDPRADELISMRAVER